MLAAILFDLDGTIVNTDPIHYQVWQNILFEYNVEINEEIYSSFRLSRIHSKPHPRSLSLSRRGMSDSTGVVSCIAPK